MIVGTKEDNGGVDWSRTYSRFSRSLQDRSLFLLSLRERAG
jgi:hypothetical protein